jgi:hypothetical protein
LCDVGCTATFTAEDLTVNQESSRAIAITTPAYGQSRLL